MIRAKLRSMARHQSVSSDYTATPVEPKDVPANVDGGGRREMKVPVDLAGLRLDQVLAQMFPEHSRSRLTAWLRDGHILVDAGAGQQRQKVWGGEVIALLATPPSAGDATDAQPEDIALEVVHEDAVVMVVNKPAGLVVHPGSGNWQGTLLNALLHHAPQLADVPRAGIVHRLDKDTSGLMVVAKTLTAQTTLVRQMQARTVKREYLAVVHGVVRADGSVDAPLGRDPRNRLKMSVIPGGKEARTHYRTLERLTATTLVECSLDTGRTHQIRVHMQSLGHPLVGDPVYRAGRPSLAGTVSSTVLEVIARFPRQALHATRLAFVHPDSGKLLHFEAKPPADFEALLKALRKAD